MSDIDWTDATIDDIRKADEEALNRWVAENRDDAFTPANRNERRYVWGEWWEMTGEYEERGEPQPYTSEWWAAGTLLEGLFLADEKVGVDCYVDEPAKAKVGGLTLTVERKPDRSEITEAITRAYLIAAKRGLLEGDDE